MIQQDFNVERVFSIPADSAYPFQPLLNIRTILKKAVMSTRDVDILKSAVENIAAYVFHHMQASVEGRTPSRAVRRLAHTLLMLDAMFAACEAVGPKAHRERWWPTLMQKIETRFSASSSSLVTFAAFSDAASDAAKTALLNNELAKNINLAINTYKAGVRPPADVLVPLKRQIFCGSIAAFMIARWEPWRQDDRDWRDSRSGARQQQS